MGIYSHNNLKRLNLIEMTDNSFFAAVNEEILQVDLWSGELIRKLMFQHIKPPNSVLFLI